MKASKKELFKDKVIMVTGGTGSIGSEIVRKLLAYPVRQVRIYSRDEFKQYSLQQEFKDQPLGRVSFLLGDIRDRDRLHMAMEGVNIVFNAAAMKHVPLCEYNPFEAVKTNVMGTQNMVDVCRASNVDKFVHVSTDKAAFPANVMGATKLLAEKISVAAEHYKGSHCTVFSAVRFGNVFGSRGSVAPLFYRQISAGGPVTLTDHKMTRFMMRISEAAELVIKAAEIAQGGEIFILKMPVMRIEDLAKAMISYLAPKYDYSPADIKVEVTGKRSGEKLYELLMTEDEADNVYENAKMFCLCNQPLPNFVKSRVKNYRSDNAPLMGRAEIARFLEQSMADIEKTLLPQGGKSGNR